jgi:LacI family transcriptional regulator
LIVEGNFLPGGGGEATLRLIQEKNRPDAIFCANDLMAGKQYMKPLWNA